MSTDIKATFAEAARWFVSLVNDIPPSEWSGPGLGEWDLRSLIGHTSRSLSTVITYLECPATQVQIPTMAAYYEWAIRLSGANPSAVAERGRQAGRELGDDPVTAIASLVDNALAALDAATADPIIETIAGGMRLSTYLPTRTFELMVHTLDIAAARGLEVTPPVQALVDALQLSTELAVRQGAGPSLLLALTGRKQLPASFSVL